MCDDAVEGLHKRRSIGNVSQHKVPYVMILLLVRLAQPAAAYQFHVILSLFY